MILFGGLGNGLKLKILAVDVALVFHVLCPSVTIFFCSIISANYILEHAPDVGNVEPLPLEAVKAGELQPARRHFGHLDDIV